MTKKSLCNEHENLMENYVGVCFRINVNKENIQCIMHEPAAGQVTWEI